MEQKCGDEKLIRETLTPLRDKLEMKQQLKNMTDKELSNLADPFPDSDWLESPREVIPIQTRDRQSESISLQGNNKTALQEANH